MFFELVSSFFKPVIQGVFPNTSIKQNQFTILLETPFPNLNSFYVCDLINIEDIGTPLLS